MARRQARRGPGRQQAAGPVFVVPDKMGRGDRRRIQQLINSQVEQAKAEAGPRVPFRFRFQLAPLAWLAAWPLGLVTGHLRAWVFLGVAAFLSVLIAAGVTRHRRAFTRWQVQGNALWAALWGVITAAYGDGWWLGLALAGWAVAYRLWLDRYQWRPQEVPPKPDTSVYDTWRELAAKQKWEAWLGAGRPIPGGMRYPITCRGTHTHITQVALKRDEVAAAYDRAVTEAYVEPDAAGKKSRGTLTIIKEGALDSRREWDGGGIDASGLGVVGRFPDGEPLRQRWFVPMSGVRHTIVAGADGTGKTGFLNLTLAMSALSGIVSSVILDPQEGQALPAWRGKIPTARGTAECMTWLRGLHAAMFERSRYLANLEWTDAKGRQRTGMDFFDARLTGLPIIEIVIDEAPILLACKGAVQLVLDIGKLGRKAGFRLVLAAQVPSISELGKQELRSMLVGGNVYCYRTGDKVTKGMVNIPADPEQLPKYFPDGSPTVGLGFADTIDARQYANMRTDWLPDPFETADNSTPRGMDPVVEQTWREIIAQGDADLAGLAAQAADDAMLQLRVISALTQPMTMGDLIAACDGVKVSQVVVTVDQLEALGRVKRDKELIEAVRG